MWPQPMATNPCDGGDDIFRRRDIIVRNKYHVEPATHQRIIVHDIRHIVDKLNYALGRLIAGRGFAAENHRAWHTIATGANAPVERDAAQSPAPAAFYSRALLWRIRYGTPHLPPSRSSVVTNPSLSARPYRSGPKFYASAMKR